MQLIKEADILISFDNIRENYLVNFIIFFSKVKQTKTLENEKKILGTFYKNVKTNKICICENSFLSTSFFENVKKHFW